MGKTATYRITGRADDGIRVYVDGVMVINAWGTGVNNFDHLVNLTQGNHTIRIEYFDEKYSAAIKLDFTEVAVPNNAWLATYYPNKNFTGLPVKRYESSNLDLNWEVVRHHRVYQLIIFRLFLKKHICSQSGYIPFYR
ncbi:PA14 domain-containing protein [Bacillus sp. N9]